MNTGSGHYEYLKIRFREATNTIPGGRTSGRPPHQISRAWQIRWIPLPISRLPSSSRAASAGSQGGIGASGRSKCSNLEKCPNIEKPFYRQQIHHCEAFRNSDPVKFFPDKIV